MCLGRSPNLSGPGVPVLSVDLSQFPGEELCARGDVGTGGQAPALTREALTPLRVLPDPRERGQADLEGHRQSRGDAEGPGRGGDGPGRSPGLPVSREAAERRASPGPVLPTGSSREPHTRHPPALSGFVFCPWPARGRLLDDSEMTLHVRSVPGPRSPRAFLLRESTRQLRPLCGAAPQNPFVPGRPVHCPPLSPGLSHC